MKRIITLLISLLIVLSACGEKDAASKLVKAELDALKEEALASLVDEVVEDEGIYDAKLNELLTAFEYEVGNEVVDGDKATVDVKVKTYDIGEALKNNYRTYFEDLVSGKISMDDDVDAYLDDNMLTELLNIEKQGKTYEKTIPVEVSKVDNKRELTTPLDENLELSDAILGGMISAYDELPYIIEEYTNQLSPTTNGNLVARYELTHMKATDYETTPEDIEMMKEQGMEAYVELYDDNVGVLNMFGEQMSFTYNDTSFNLSGLNIPYTLHEGRLSFSIEDSTFDFGLAE